MRIDEQKERNDFARKQITRINKECGLRFGFIASKLSMNYNSFANWKGHAYELGKNRLEIVEGFIRKYDDIK